MAINYVPPAAEVDTSPLVAKADYDANTVLAADTDDTPVTVSLAASQILGRKATGGIVAMTMGELREIIGSGRSDTTFLRGDGTWAAPSSGLSAAILRGALGYDANTIEPFPRWAAVGGDAALTSGTAEWACFTALENITVSKIKMMVGGTASAGSPTLRRMGLATVASNGDITVVARTANDTSLFNATFTAFERSFDTGSGFPATYDLVAGNRYAAGVIAVGGTMPALQRMLMANGNNDFFGIAPRLTIGKTAQTDLTDITVAAGITPSAARWARLSA